MKKKLLRVMLMAAMSSTALSVHAQLFDNFAGDDDNPSAQTQPNPQDSNGLMAYMRDSKDIEANFKQITYNQRGQETSEGHMWVAKPGKFFWDYQSPYPQQIISDGRNVYHYDMDLEQITVRSKDELVGDVAIRLLEGQNSLSDEFTIEQIANNAIPSFINLPSANTIVYSLTPKVDNNEYNGVWVVFDHDELAQVIVDGGTGQQTVMTFSDLKRNQGISAQKFKFTPPEGVDVVGNIQ